MMRRLARSAGMLAALLAGCAGPPPMGRPVESPSAAAAPAAPSGAMPAPHSLVEFERRHREQAEAASRQERWLDAAGAWDVVLALRPQDTEAARRRAQAESSAAAAAAEKLRRARQARQRGETDTALRLFLETLALAPDNAAAAEGLRAIEFDRQRRAHAHPPPRPPAAVKERSSASP